MASLTFTKAYLVNVGTTEAEKEQEKLDFDPNQPAITNASISDNGTGTFFTGTAGNDVSEPVKLSARVDRRADFSERRG